MQAASDLFLGWSKDASLHVDFYVRQLHDCKTAANIDTPWMIRTSLLMRTIAARRSRRRYAKSGDAAAISGDIGQSEALDAAVTRFAARYADQTEQDFERLKAAAKNGRPSSPSPRC